MARAKDLDWNDLRHLLAAARAGTLAGAARQMGVEHTTIGRRLAALERALGGSLVLRRPDGLTLTALGERVAAAAEQVEQAVAGVRDAAVTEQSRVRVAVPSGFAGLFTPQLHRLRDLQPPIVLELVSGSRIMDLVRGEADLAVRLGPITDPDLVARRVGDIGWSLYAAADYIAHHPPARDPLDLGGHRVIGYDATLGDTPPARWIEAHAASANVVMRSRELVDMVTAAAAGAGIALLPCHLGDTTTQLLRLTPTVLTRRELWLVYRREMRLSAAVQAAIRFTIDVIAGARALLLGEPVP
jgi:DNA-binding transcriptional LysR family regulator